MAVTLCMSIICVLHILALADDSCGADGTCADDPIRSGLLDWYANWSAGFQVDFIDASQLRDTYDFIVVGAGVGGSVVAHRLAMDASQPAVLLLEAGAQHDASALSSQTVPILVEGTQLSDVDWQYRSEPSEGHCCDWHVDKRQAMPRGKVTGGSGVLNYMIWVRGHRQDWDVTFDVDGWAWDDVLPYFKSIESVRHHQHNASDAAHRG